jgi:hypothetical protein
MHLLKLFSFSTRVKFFCLLFSLASFSVWSQNLVQGTVMDSISSTPISNVYVRTRHSATVSDADGNFSLVVSPGDSLHFTHISYYDSAIAMDYKTHDPKIKMLRIFLRQKIRLLNEVKIYSYLSERVFKQKIIETIPQLSREEEIAAINSRIISYLARHAPTSPMDAHDNFVDYMKGPQGVVIFSSNPSKGLIRAFKNIINPATSSYKKFFNADSLEKAPRFH